MNEEQLNEKILEHLAIILGKAEGDLAASLAALDSLKSETKGHLSHYLANRSYQKAWILLQGEDPEKGTC